MHTNSYQASARFAPGQLVLRLLYVFCICLYIWIYLGLYIRTYMYHMLNNYVTHIVVL